MSQRNTSGQIDATTKRELQERWKHLELKTSTLLHLQEVLDRRGIAAAVAVTDVVAREKRPKMVDMGKEWSFEELRLMTLEGVRPRLVDLIRFILESLIAWHFIHVPDGAVDGMVEIVIAVLFCVFGVGAICVTCRCRAKGQITRGKRPDLIARFKSILHIPRENSVKSLPPKISSR
jgi:hypothetical protein